ncbi:aminotransferase class III-fold pyridoxal phosphate-dependent enzyme [Dongia rigui]|uniref:Aminotransferase class III-fold pyridoxal phosphate-dependent enzyme n=1 Tax=Dongia rigui TaxID=940149 RepID=A0ABU5E2S2_9PROT|nr:aminotransferase class III-fold pyridoxal phosphate-dependent enzyme [Dongia rigui]MDY0873880.1 aminotransferase class III-fold pyridoxal phosphate-dependent enzyme [Dongia rigui]
MRPAQAALIDDMLRRVLAGQPAHETVPHLRRWLDFNNHRFGPVVDAPLDRDHVAILDASLAPERLAHPSQNGGENLTAWWRAQLARIAPRIGIGRYAEDRGIYDHPEAPREANPRKIHHAIDIFLPAGSKVLCPYPGTVADIGNDTERHGFGGILILRHETDAGVPFWTFYGHLAPAGLAGWKPGQVVAQGTLIGTLASEAENGDWPPHLHFQLMTHLMGWEALDVIGISWASQWELWREICLDPNIILGIGANCAAPVARSPLQLVAERRRHFAPSASLAYAQPLKIVRGAGCHLYDETGRAYLDMVNNVAHVGHSHPRVVEASARQMAALNTNSRYLHDHLAGYIKRLADILPPELSVIYLVNSGSEANDLALRLAQAHTQARDVVVVDHAYHGHLSNLIDISPYKFDGPGGGGRPSHVWVAEMPDTYRGRLRDGGKDIGAGYAESVATLLMDMIGLGRKPMAFIAESIQGCGGQIPFPPGYLDAAYRHIRREGGVCIADEVQTGFGRVGTHWWAFETQGVTPDIVTMGKPMGAGHPLAAVATRPEIAAAFAGGMEYFNTFGGNPVSAAIGLAVLDIIRDERLLANARARGMQLMDGLRVLAGRHPAIGHIRGLGLFIGAEFVQDRTTLQPDAAALKTVIEGMKDAGVLLSSEGPHHNVLKVKPPMVISEQECAHFLGLLDRVLTELGR